MSGAVPRSSSSSRRGYSAPARLTTPPPSGLRPGSSAAGTAPGARPAPAPPPTAGAAPQAGHSSAARTESSELRRGCARFQAGEKTPLSPPPDCQWPSLVFSHFPLPARCFPEGCRASEQRTPPRRPASRLAAILSFHGGWRMSRRGSLRDGLRPLLTAAAPHETGRLWEEGVQQAKPSRSSSSGPARPGYCGGTTHRHGAEPSARIPDTVPADRQGCPWHSSGRSPLTDSSRPRIANGRLSSQRLSWHLECAHDE
jgi:hypothetical protein